MADQKMWLLNSFKGGYSDDKLAGLPDSFQESSAVEVRENPRSLTLARAMEKNSESVVVDMVRAMATIQSTGDIIGCDESGRIYRRAGGAGSWVECWRITKTNKLITDCFEYNDYFYIATQTYLHRIAVADIDNDWTTDIDEEWQAFTNGNINQHPFIEINNNMYVGDGNYLSEYSSSGVWTDNKITIFGDEEIRALTFSGGMMRIYARKLVPASGNGDTNYGRCYLWNGISGAYNEAIAWAGLPIHAAVNKDGTDFVIAGVRPSIYVTNGYERTLVKRLPNVSQGQSLEIHNNAIDIYNDLLVFGVGQSGTYDLSKGVYTYGALDKNYAPCLNFDYPPSQSSVSNIGCVHVSKGVLYASYKTSTPAYGIDVCNTAKYASSGYVISRMFVGDLASLKKHIVDVMAAFATLAEGEAIDIHVRINGAASWTSVANIAYSRTNEDGDYADQNVNYREVTRAFSKSDFNMIEIKITLTAGTSQLTTPEFLELATTFQYIRTQ